MKYLVMAFENTIFDQRKKIRSRSATIRNVTSNEEFIKEKQPKEE